MLSMAAHKFETDKAQLRCPQCTSVMAPRVIYKTNCGCEMPIDAIKAKYPDCPVEIKGPAGRSIQPALWPTCEHKIDYTPEEMYLVWGAQGVAFKRPSRAAEFDAMPNCMWLCISPMINFEVLSDPSSLPACIATKESLMIIDITIDATSSRQIAALLQPAIKLQCLGLSNAPWKM